MIAICVEEKADEAEEEAERKDIKPSSFEALYKEVVLSRLICKRLKKCIEHFPQICRISC
jgi:hypothetical protein